MKWSSSLRETEANARKQEKVYAMLDAARARQPLLASPGDFLSVGLIAFAFTGVVRKVRCRHCPASPKPLTKHTLTQQPKEGKKGERRMQTTRI